MHQNRRILYFCLQPIDQKPPCVTECLQLCDLGCRVTVVTNSCSSYVKNELESKGCRIVIIPEKHWKAALPRRIYNVLLHQFMWPGIIRKYWTEDSVLWVGTEQSWILHYRNIRLLRPVIVNCLEFYENSWYQEGMKRHLDSIDILTACEPSRADYMVSWWGLPKKPYILRNKPYSHPRKRFLPGSTEETRNAIAQMEGKTIVYQGAIVGDRDLSRLAEALQDMKMDYELVLSGPAEAGAVEKLQRIYPHVTYLGNIPAPLHLEITSHAHICVAFYKDNSINNRYCAPNKLYEYAGFGIPMLCNNIPGLTSTVGAYEAGVCVDFNDQRALEEGILQIERQYDEMSRNSSKLYDETDNSGTIKQIVEEAFSL